MDEAPLCLPPPSATSARTTRYKAAEPEQWLQRHPEAGSSWPSWPKASKSAALASSLGAASEREGNSVKYFKDLNLEAEAEFGRDCLMCAIFARQRHGQIAGSASYKSAVPRPASRHRLCRNSRWRRVDNTAVLYVPYSLDSASVKVS